MANVCGWVVIFRVILAFCERWFLWLLPQPLQIGFVGLLELSNGCYSLRLLMSEPLRFVMCVCFLSFGGLCVAMQTTSVTKELGTGLYFPGKLLQGCFSLALAAAVQYFLFPGTALSNAILPVILLLIICVTGIRLAHRKKVVAIP